MMAVFAPVRRINSTAHVVARGQSFGRARARNVVAHGVFFHMLTNILPRCVFYGMGAVPPGVYPGETEYL